MIHTVELRVNCSDFGIQHDIWYRFAKDKKLCNATYPGFIFDAAKSNPDSPRTPYIWVRINLYRTIHPGEDDLLGIYTGKDTEAIIAKINAVFQEVGLPEVQYWTLNRVDFTIDIRTEFVDTYVKLLKRCGYIYDTEHRQHGLYIPCQRKQTKKKQTKRKPTGKTINFYNKAEQQRVEYGEPEAAKAKGILRLEVQCFSRHPIFAYLGKDKRTLPDLLYNQELLVQGVEMSVGKELKAIVGESPYYKKDYIKLKIQESKNQGRIKQQLTEMVEWLNSGKRSINSLRKHFCGGNKPKCSKQTFSSRLKDINELGVNLVCLPSDCIVDILPSLYELYTKQLQAEEASEP